MLFSVYLSVLSLLCVILIFRELETTMRWSNYTFNYTRQYILCIFSLVKNYGLLLYCAKGDLRFYL